MPRRTPLSLLLGAVLAGTALCAASPQVSAIASTSITRAATVATTTSTLPPVHVPPGRCLTGADVAAWPLSAQIGHVVMIGVPIAEAARARALAQRFTLGGVLVRGTPTSASGPAIKAIRDARPGLPTIIAVDEEGGRVQHLRTAIGIFPSARRQAELTPAELRTRAAAYGRSMRALGFTMNLAPDVDLSNGNPSIVGTNGIGDRAYSTDPDVVTAYAGAFADGMLDAGLVPVLKHFPGHGNASADSHRKGPSTPAWDVLRAYDLRPFAQITAERGTRIGVMIGHLWVTGGENRPASISRSAITTVLRQELGFDGLVVTDSLSMWPIRSALDAPRAAEESLKAGADLLLYDNSPVLEPIIAGLSQAVTGDPELARALITANLRVLRAAGLPVCRDAVAVAAAAPLVASATPTTTPTTTTTAKPAV